MEPEVKLPSGISVKIVEPALDLLTLTKGDEEIDPTTLSDEDAAAIADAVRDRVLHLIKTWQEWDTEGGQWD